jgi:hypothetical protein
MNKFESIEYFIYHFEGIVVRGLLCVGTIILLIGYLKSKLKK